MSILNFFRPAKKSGNEAPVKPPPPKQVDLSISEDDDLFEVMPKSKPVAKVTSKSTPAKVQSSTTSKGTKSSDPIDIEVSPPKPAKKTGKIENTNKSPKKQPSPTVNRAKTPEKVAIDVEEEQDSPSKRTRAAARASPIGAPKPSPTKKSPKKSSSKSGLIASEDVKHVNAGTDDNGFVDSIDEYSSTPKDSKKRAREESELDVVSTPTKKLKTMTEEAKTVQQGAKSVKESVKSTPEKKKPKPTKTATTPSKTPSLARELSSPDKLAALNIKTFKLEEVDMMPATYGNFMNRSGPPLHGQKEAPQGDADCLQGFVFVITGVLESLEREEAAELIEKCGGKVSKTLSKKVTHAVVGKDAGPSKMNQIQERNIPALDEDGLFDLIRKLSKNITLDQNPTQGTGITQELNNVSFTSDNPNDWMEVDQEIAPPVLTGKNLTETNESTKNQMVSTSTPTKTPSMNTSMELVTQIPSASSTKKISPVKKLNQPQSLTVTLPSPVHPQISTLWTDKYKPIVSKDLVGNPGNVEKLLGWLRAWDVNYAKDKATVGKSSFPRAILLTGPPGVGKTCSAMIAAKECGYTPVHMNASDQRSKSTLQEKVAGLLSNRGITEFFGMKTSGPFAPTISTPSTGSKTVLIMDEIDGMSSGDRGGLAELNTMIKTTKVPIIALANDKYKVRTLAGSSSVVCLNFGRPTTQQLQARISLVCKYEKLFLSDETLRRIIESCQGDLRMILNCLQMVSNSPGALISTSGVNNNAAVDAQIKSASKDMTLGPFDVVPKLFREVVSNGLSGPFGQNPAPAGYATTSFNDRIEHYFVDYSFVPLFIQHNYLKTKMRSNCFKSPANNKQTHAAQLKELKDLSKAADAMSEGDIIGHNIFSQQNYSLLPVQGATSTLYPCAILNSSLGGQIEFPSVLGKGSSSRKRQGLLSELQAEMYVTSGGSNSTGILLDYMPLLTHSLTSPLIKKEQEGIQDVIDFMEQYSISREGRESVLELCELKYDKSQKDAGPASKIPTNVKTAFTRTYNAGAHSVVAKRSKKKAADDGKTEQEETEMGMEEADALEEDEDADGIEMDSLVSIAKPKKAKSTASKTPGLTKAKSTGTKTPAKKTKAK